MDIGDRVKMIYGPFEGIPGTIVETRLPLGIKDIKCKEKEYIVRWDDSKYGESNWMKRNELQQIS